MRCERGVCRASQPLPPGGQFQTLYDADDFYYLHHCGAGSVASITHLGVPLNAPNAVNNVFSARLSREVVVTAAFVGALGVSFLWLWKTGKFSSCYTAAPWLSGWLIFLYGIDLPLHLDSDLE